MFTIRKSLALVVLSVSLTAASSAKAQSYEHIDRLASQLQRQSANLYWEFRAHFSHTPGYRHLLSDTARMYRLAAHVHEVIHHGANVGHIRHDVEQLDRAFHHVEEVVDQIEHDAFGHGFGHVHGDTRHVRRQLRQMEATLHHLRDDVRW
jgi:negative regulator of sigma E activity